MEVHLFQCKTTAWSAPSRRDDRVHHRTSVDISYKSSESQNKYVIIDLCVISWSTSTCNYNVVCRIFQIHLVVVCSAFCSLLGRTTFECRLIELHTSHHRGPFVVALHLKDEVKTAESAWNIQRFLAIRWQFSSPHSLSSSSWRTLTDNTPLRYVNLVLRLSL